MQKQRNQHQNQTSNQSNHSNEQTFIDHLHELRARLFWVFGSLFLTSTIAYSLHSPLVNLVVAPLHGNKLIYLNPGGGFTFIFTICLYFGALATIPVTIYHLYRFLQPVLGKSSRQFIVGIVSASIMLAILGVVFGYILVIPGALHFLGEFAGGAASASLTTDSYLNFVVLHLFGMAALFQLPLLLFISDHIRPFPPGTLLRLQRWVVAGSLIAAALITPTPDPINLALVALPIIGVYQIGVIVVWARRRKFHAIAAEQPIEVEDQEDQLVAAIIAERPIQKPLTATISRPVVSAPKAAVITSVPQPVAPIAPLMQSSKQRSIDGFGYRQPAPNAFAYRPRTVVAPRRAVVTPPQRRPITPGQPLRRPSINGFTTA